MGAVLQTHLKKDLLGIGNTGSECQDSVIECAKHVWQERCVNLMCLEHRKCSC